MAAHALYTDLPRFRANKSRVSDLYEHSGNEIRERKTVMATATIFTEMDWLVKEIGRFNAPPADDAEAKRVVKIAKFVDRVNAEHANAIKTGDFLKISAEIFGSWRFLIRVLERALLRVVDDAVAASLIGDVMPDEHVGRIQLDLSEGVADPSDAPPIIEKKP